MSGPSPTSRSLTIVRDKGYLAQVVEHWNPHAHIRQDLYGFVDLLAIHGAPPHILAIQACAGASHAARATKIRNHPNLPAVLASGIRVEVWSWAKQGPRGARKLWMLRTETITSPHDTYDLADEVLP